MSKIDFDRLSSGLLSAEFEGYELTPEEDDVAYAHFRIAAIWAKADGPRIRWLGDCEQGIWEWETEAECIKAIEALELWQAQQSAKH
ncbi:hypothetical protein KUW19_00920 [Ferrimonas balearica]|uniref:hypothetical protein n=1 Tax=Ferrimonas balearica TaxID=44012 RepID=UPI001C939ED3|nr:hypothetical protein [Ferrimonas balearica]MBY6105039.1 hypothetical protein [Ferrimonas balearica]